MTLNNSHELLFLVARDFIKLDALQQINIGIKLDVCGIDAALLPVEEISEVVFKAAYERNKIPALIKEMRYYLYE